MQPLLFSGTIRTNLDPFNKYDDARLWDALRRAYLVENYDGTTSKKIDALDEDVKEPIEDFQGADDGGDPHALTFHSGTATPVNRFHLDTVIESEGSNLSVGERSLLSLARALVKDTRIVVLDEAT